MLILIEQYASGSYGKDGVHNKIQFEFKFIQFPEFQ